MHFEVGGVYVLDSHGMTVIAKYHLQKNALFLEKKKIWDQKVIDVFVVFGGGCDGNDIKIILNFIR